MSNAREGNSLLRPPAVVAPLLAALANPAECGEYDETQWDRLIRLARNARLLGVLGHRVLACMEPSRVPERVHRHLQAGLIEARFRRQKAIHLLHTITPLLEGHPGPWVLLKGAAYIVQDLPLSHGRLPGDVDLMVPRPSLDGVERALLDAGWEFENTDPYDQHYYRAWSHELPPLRAAGQVLELDLHHTIVAPVGRIRPAVERLFADARPVDGTRFHVLCADDQLLHAIVHLVYDSDFAGRLRDLVDIDAMFRSLPPDDAAAIERLTARAALHGMAQPLAFAAALCDAWFGTPGCKALAGAAPLTGLYGERILHLASRVLGPPDTGHEVSRSARFTASLLGAREHWLRMPPWLLAYHGTAKGLRGITGLFGTRTARS